MEAMLLEFELWNSNCAYFLILDFQRTKEICINGIKVRYAEYIFSLSIVKGGVDMI